MTGVPHVFTMLFAMRSMASFGSLFPRMRKQIPVPGSVQRRVLQVFSVGSSAALPLAEEVTAAPASLGSPSQSWAGIPCTVTVSGVPLGAARGCLA